MYKINNKCYDLSEFIKIHPGGKDMFNYLVPFSNITPIVCAYHNKNVLNILHNLLHKYEVPMFKNILYDNNFTYDAYWELKQLVYNEIYEKNIPLHWTNQEICRNMCLLVLYIGLWVYCLYYSITISTLCIIGLGCVTMFYGSLIMHETSHHVGFKNQNINNLLSFCIIPSITPNHEWKFDHNYLHHSFTNSKYDNDFEYNKWILRHSNEHKHYNYHKIQYLYISIICVIATFLIGPYRSIEKKRWNIFVSIYILYKFGIYNTFIYYAVTGSILILIAQINHIQDKCIQNIPEKNDFLYNQVTSSMNYKTNYMTQILSMGLDIQIEHHLFPNIPHSSLKQIQPIVRSYCNKHNIPYVETSGMFTSIYLYIKYLYKMGNP